MAIGQRVPMIDAAERVSGRVRYALNVTLPGMLVGRALRSPHPHARIVRVDSSRAEHLSGVLGVLTGAELMNGERFDPFYGPIVRDQPVLALDRVRFAGEPVAAVAAIDDETAERALELIEVEYEPLDAVFDPRDALLTGAPRVHADGNLLEHFQLERGNLKRGFAEADFVFEDEFCTASVQQVPLEPHVSVAQVQGDRVTVWSATQTPSHVRAQLAAIFKLPESRVRVIVHTLGGGYGSKAWPKLEPLAALLAWRTGRPVRVALPRSEDFLMSRRSPARLHLKSGVMRDGTIVAQHLTCYYDKGAYVETGPRVARAGAYAASAPYRILNRRIDAYTVFTHLPPAGPYRAPGVAQATWAGEAHMDAITRRLGMDPLTLRRKNLVRDGDRYVGGGVLEDLHFEELLDRAVADIGWREPRPAVGARLRRGTGLGVTLKIIRNPSIGSATCKLNEDGSLDVLAAGVEMGQGAQTVFAQMAAEAASVPLRQVKIAEIDTDSTPYDDGTTASRTTFVVGSAIARAGAEIRRQLVKLAAAELEVAREDVELVDGLARVSGAPTRSIPYAQLVRGARRGNLMGHGTFVSQAKPNPLTGEPGASEHWHHAVAAAEVEVDVDTGRVRVVRAHAGVYVGRAINPLQCELQIEGSAIFGLGQALFEELAFDDGRLGNPNLSDYMLPSFEDLPPALTVNVQEGPGADAIHGVGETALPPMLAAIANAVADAIGAPVRELPITPERVLRALQGGPVEHRQEVSP